MFLPFVPSLFWLTGFDHEIEHHLGGGFRIFNLYLG